MRIPLVTATCLFLLFGCNSKPTIEKEPSVAEPNAGSSAPDFVLESTTGEKVGLSDFKGKVVLLDFWATWCPPCRMSTPLLVKLNENFKNKNFALVGISLDENKNAVGPYLKKAKADHLVLFGEGSGIEQNYRVRAIPTFFLLDQSGKLVKEYSGFYPGMEKEWEKDIQILLAKNQ